jgi:hypothetical protein
MGARIDSGVLVVGDVADLCMRLCLVLAGLLLSSSCYHYRFRHGPAAGTGEAGRTVTYEIRSATYLNGFVGTGEVDVGKYCPDPVHTELRVRASDVLLSLATLLIYTPHTLYVTCPRDAAATGDRDQPAARRTGA